ncbi:MAG: class I adenylate-forming enzyme family protein [Myxococcota bacterium]|nr:class I adenylate-forming enzyme family protein [Myxococcota bacterium]
MNLVEEFLLKSAEKTPDKLAFGDPKTALTYEELTSRVMGFAFALSHQHQVDEERILILLPNSVDFMVCHLGVIASGNISVPCDCAIGFQSLEQILACASPKVLITTRVVHERLHTVLTASSIKSVLFVDGLPERNLSYSRGVFILNEILEPSLSASLIRKSNLPASIMYTTGSTALAKGVVLTHENIFAAISEICEFVGYTPNDKEVVVLPLSHSFGLGHVYSNFYKQGFVYTENGLTRIKRVLNKIESLGATGFPGTPLGFSILMDRYGDLFAEKARSLRFSVINSAPLPPAQTAALQKLLPNLNIFVYYGLTEASRSTFISLTHHGPDYYASVGKPMNNVHLEIVNEEGEPADPHEVGEVMISSPRVASHYWENEAESQASFKQGTLRTGDLAFQDPDGFVFLVGRKKDVINIGGLKVNPKEVEEVVRSLDYVRDVAVLGLEGYGNYGEASVIAAICMKDGREVSDETLNTRCQEKLENYKVPHRFVKLTQIPKSETGKVKRKELATILHEKLASADLVDHG